MSELDDFMLSHNDESDTTMGTENMTCNSQTFPVVVNILAKTVDGEYGGLEPQIRGTVVAQPADITNPMALLNKRVSINSVVYRITGVDVGTIGITFTLGDPNETR
jgi:hypothetical protein